MNTCEIWCKIWFGKNGPKERGDLDSKQHEEVQADTDEAAAGGDTSDPAEGGFVAVRQGHGRDDLTFSRGKMARKKEWTRPRTRW